MGVVKIFSDLFQSCHIVFNLTTHLVNQVCVFSKIFDVFPLLFLVANIEFAVFVLGQDY